MRNKRNIFELCAEAGEMLKKAGFQRVHVSMRSEAVYYQLPGRYGVIRVAAHRGNKPPIGLDAIIAKITFMGNSFNDLNMIHISEGGVLNRIAYAIGIYMINSMEPRASRYFGKKGTWENENQSSMAGREKRDISGAPEAEDGNGDG